MGLGASHLQLPGRVGKNKFVVMIILKISPVSNIHLLISWKLKDAKPNSHL